MKYLLGAFIVASALDLGTTLVGLRLGQPEGNPLFAWLLGYGLVVFALTRIAIVVGVVGVMHWTRRRHRRAWAMLVAPVTVTWLVVASNLLLIVGG